MAPPPSRPTHTRLLIAERAELAYARRLPQCLPEAVTTITKPRLARTFDASFAFVALENVQHPLRVRHGHRRRDVFELEHRCLCRLTCGGRRREPRSALPASSATRAPPPPWHARPARELRAIAVGRRNWTFAGSDAGGRRAAAVYTLVATAKLND